MYHYAPKKQKETKIAHQNRHEIEVKCLPGDNRKRMGIRMKKQSRKFTKHKIG
jgi:hypothetical protein